MKWSVKDLSKLRPNGDLKITFTAKIKLDAELGEDLGIPNEASLNFDNQRGEFSDPKNPPTTPPVYVTPRLSGLKILKVDKHDSTLLLQGAKFQISRDQAGKEIVQGDQLKLKVNGRPYSGPLKDLVTTEKGEILIENLPAGTYYLTETKAPTYRDQEGNVQNYRLLTKPVKFTINSSTEIKELVIKNSKSKWFVPRTGGLGTIIFTAVGIAFIVASIIMLLRIRHDNQEKQITV